MSKVNKFPFVRFFMIMELIALAVAVGSSVLTGATVTKKARYESEYADKAGFYSDAGFDLLISGASSEQVGEFGTKDFITHAVRASKISLHVKTGSSEDYRDIIVFDSEEDLAYSEFTESRMISEKTATKFVYADYKFCSLYDVKLGDNIAITMDGNTEEYCISRVYRTDYLYSEGILIATEDMIPLNAKSLYVYLTTDNKDALISYLQDYKPMGTLLSKTSVQSDADYQKYLDEFNGKEYYSSYVTDLSDKKAGIENDYEKEISATASEFNISVILVSVVCLSASLLCFFVNAKNRKDRIYKYIQENGNRRIIGLFTVFNLSFAVFMLIGTGIAMRQAVENLTTYYTFASILHTSYPALLAPVASIFVGFLITFIKAKKA